MKARDSWEPTPVALTLDLNLSPAARGIYPLLRHLAWQRTREHTDDITAELPSLSEIAETFGCSVTALKGYLAELRRAGWVTTRRAARARPLIYTMHLVRCEPESDPHVSRNPTHSRARDSEEVPDELPDTEGAIAPSVARPANIVFDAVAEETNANVAVSAGEIAKAVKAIRAAEADTIQAHTEEFLAANPAYDAVPPGRIDAYLAAKIRQRAQRYRECRDWELTPTALAKHWNRIPTWQPDRKLSADELANVDLSRYGL